MIRYEYPAQNVTLPATTNRTLRLADVEKVRALVWENLLGLEAIVRWNADRGIRRVPAPTPTSSKRGTGIRSSTSWTAGRRT